MWDRSYRWQRVTRVAVGAAAVCLGIVAAVGLSRTRAATRLAAAAGELSSAASRGSATNHEVLAPIALGVRPAHLVYLDRRDGGVQVAGSVVAVEPGQDGLAKVVIRLTPAGHEACDAGGVIRGAAPPVNLEEVLRLVVSPDLPRDEAVRARDAIWPRIEEKVLPPLSENFVREVQALFTDVDSRDRQLVQAALEELDASLAPLVKELMARLARRAWHEVGVGGVAEGVWRKFLEKAENEGKDLRDWVLAWFGRDRADDRVAREFLTEEAAEALRAALADEFASFWDEHSQEVLHRTEQVLAAKKQELGAAFHERWQPMLWERVIEPAWLEGEADVLQAAQTYAEDFANRRLVTQDGGPKLVLAHALRGLLKISDAPLLVLAPSDIVGLTYEPLVP